jgi:hypothetical protein
MIHQKRKILNPKEEFKYIMDSYDICNQFGMNLKSQGKYTWNKLKRKNYGDCLWQKEWPECSSEYLGFDKYEEQFIG